MRPATKKRIRELGFKSYTAYCRSDVWKARRALYWKKHRKRCWICGSTTRIVLHHTDYTRVGGAERDSDLLPLCSPHHRGLHNFMKHHRVKLEQAHRRYKAHLAKKK